MKYLRQWNIWDNEQFETLKHLRQWNIWDIEEFNVQEWWEHHPSVLQGTPSATVLLVSTGTYSHVVTYNTER